jgi:hypothetical protein
VGRRSSQHRALRFNRLVLGSPNHSTRFSNYKTNLVPGFSATPVPGFAAIDASLTPLVCNLRASQPVQTRSGCVKFPT